MSGEETMVMELSHGDGNVDQRSSAVALCRSSNVERDNLAWADGSCALRRVW